MHVAVYFSRFFLVFLLSQSSWAYTSSTDELLEAFLKEELDEGGLWNTDRNLNLDSQAIANELGGFYNPRGEEKREDDENLLTLYLEERDELYFFSRKNKNDIARWLRRYQYDLSKWRRKAGLLAWNKETNLTKYNSDLYAKTSLVFSAWNEGKRKQAEKFDLRGLDYEQRRMIRKVTKTSELKEKNLKITENKLSSEISSTYSKAKVCKASGKCYHFEPGLIKIMRQSRNYDELLWAWKGWRDAIGPKIRTKWIEVMKLNNKGAKEQGYNDEGDYIRSLYEDPNFERDIDDLWKDIKPLYNELHAYVRYKLHGLYGDRVALDKPIPAHLLGEMWAMKWDSLLKVVEPYPDVGGFDVTGGMKEKKITTQDMFTLADQFYRSMGLPPMPPLFWEKSMFTRPKDGRPVVCYASAHNLEHNDVRVKMCAAVNAEYFYVVHHEMGHCQYYLAYNRHQPEIFQAGANSGFHEAIGDTAALSVISPKHLESLGIIKPGKASVKQKKLLNFLMQKALSKLSFYPFALTMAKWKWDVNSGKIPISQLNSAWWRYRKKYQGIAPPIARTEKDFDPGCKYHIANFVPYIRYFVSHVLQFQFYESLCHLANQPNLHNCDFANSTAAGTAFGQMLQMGSSRPWPDALETLTGTRKMSARSLIRYFKPLTDWLKAENKRLGNKIGWI